MFCAERPYNCQVLFLFCCHVSHPIWFCVQNFWRYIFLTQMWNFPTPLVFLQNCPTAKKLLFVRGSSWAVTLTRDNIFLPKLSLNYITWRHFTEFAFESQQKLNMKIMLEVTTRSRTNGLTSRLVGETRTDVRTEFADNTAVLQKCTKGQRFNFTKNKAEKGGGLLYLKWQQLYLARHWGTCAWNSQAWWCLMKKAKFWDNCQNETGEGARGSLHSMGLHCSCTWSWHVCAQNVQIMKDGWEGQRINLSKSVA